MTKRLFATLWVFLLLPSCGKKEKLNSTAVDRGTSERKPEIFNKKPIDLDPKSSSTENHEAALKKAFGSKRRGAVQVKEFRSNLLALAKKRGVEPMAIAAPLIIEAKSPEDQFERMIWVIDAFDDPKTQIQLANALPAGKIRKLVLSSAISEFEAKEDTLGLKAAYDSLPVGGDRTNLAGALSKSIFHEEGVHSGLEFISKLEMPEERYASMLNTKDQWAGQINDPETKLKLEQILSTMEGHLRDNMNLLISSINRR